ncbi:MULTISPECIES: hypothetical protein [unclassified Clostridium]|uniref:hypothetical protein n=1 Tax=unclassified Clostridium TaxID=2614128 RepID=UPI0002975046|nr:MULTISPECIES: hypothetical protein [unclassified Clostridium]EKQ55892.1 MAG: hypothetical protein A370_02465 [Clostridium sp. Maddingley MBC34-26]
MNKENFDYDKKVNLDEILKDAYIRTHKEDKTEHYYESSKSTSKKNLLKIFKVLDIDMDNYKIMKGKKPIYEIPFIVAKLIQIYVEEEYNNNSLIEKIKSNDIEGITYKEKAYFIDKVVNHIKSKYPNDEKIIKEINELKSFWKVQAKFHEDIMNQLKVTNSMTHTLINRYIKMVSAIDKFDGLIAIDDKTKELMESDTQFAKDFQGFIKYETLLKYSLSMNDRKEIVNYLKYCIINGIKEWFEVVNQFYDIRDAETGEFEVKKCSDSKEILKEAIELRKENIIRNMKPTTVASDNMDKQMKELRELFKN